MPKFTCNLSLQALSVQVHFLREGPVWRELLPPSVPRKPAAQENLGFENKQTRSSKLQLGLCWVGKT